MSCMPNCPDTGVASGTGEGRSKSGGGKDVVEADATGVGPKLDRL